MNSPIHSISFDLTRQICGQTSRERLLKRTRLKRAQYRVYGVREAEAGRDEVRPPWFVFLEKTKSSTLKHFLC